MKKTSPALEYMIEWAVPEAYDSDRVLRQLPSPISSHMREIYNYAVRRDGFYLIDRGVDRTVSAVVLKIFVDEALAQSGSVTVRRL